MELNHDFYNRQLEAIQHYYAKLNEDKKEPISLTEAIISWFTEGHAEEFRESYLHHHTALMQ